MSKGPWSPAQRAAYQARRLTNTQAFWKFVHKLPGKDACWEWIGGCMPLGYGIFTPRLKNGKHRSCRAHRYAWKLYHGAYPELMVLHKCDNRRCVREDHLFLGTHKDNMKDMRVKGRAAAGARNGTPRGEAHPSSKITDAQADEIRRRGKTESYAALAKEFGIDQSHASRIARGLTHRSSAR